MESLYLLIPIAIIFVCVAVAIFIWAVKNDQFEDLEKHGMSIFFERDEPESKKKSVTEYREKNRKIQKMNSKVKD